MTKTMTQRITRIATKRRRWRIKMSFRIGNHSTLEAVMRDQEVLNIGKFPRQGFNFLQHSIK